MSFLRRHLHQLVRNFYFGSSGTPGQLLRFILKPLAPVYRALFYLNQRRRRHRQKSLPVPVLSVGNLSVGGTGKTAFVKYLLELLVAAGIEPGVLKRGEGPRKGVVVADSDSGNLVEYGDEVALLARSFPGVGFGIGAERYRTGRKLIERCSPDIIVLDDGFQHVQLERDLDVVLLGRVEELEDSTLPVGPLREPPSALERADLVSIKGRAGGTDFSDYTSAPVLNHFYELKKIERNGKPVGAKLKGGRLQLLTTLARPNDLVDFLEAAGYHLDKTVFLPDHAELDPGFVRENFQPSRLLVTEKEFYKLPQEIRRRVNLVRSKLKVEPAEKLRTKLGQLLEAEI